jgi:hypothetical protein
VVTPARQSEKSASKSRIATAVGSIEEMVGAHERALEAIFMRNNAADPAALGDSPRGRVLTLAGTASVHLAAREVIRLLSRGGAAIWQGIHFDHGGNAGSHLVFGKQFLRFRVELTASALDAAPALVLRYTKAGPIFAKLHAELRNCGEGLAMGPVFLGKSVIGWVGLTRA